MVRFVQNLHRNEYLDEFNTSRKILDKPDLRKEEDSDIRNCVEGSF